MPNPTQYFGWTLPVEGQDPYFEAIDDTFNAIDSSISSVGAALLPHATLVMSIYPAGDPDGVMLISSDTFSIPEGPWAICSVAPFGGCRGDFTLVNSGAHASLDLRLSGLWHAPVGQITTWDKIRFRLIVSRIGVNSLIIPNNSSWILTTNQERIHIATAFTATMSLGPGTFTAELQASSTVSPSSLFLMNQHDSINLLAMEVTVP